MMMANQIINKEKGGFTLVELLMVVLLTGILMAVMIKTSNFWSRSSVALVNYSDMNMQSRRALDTIGRDIRMASQVTGCSSNSISIEIPGVTVDDFTVITYQFNAAKNELTRSDGTSTHSVLRDVKVVEFTLKNLQGNITESMLEAKLVQIFVKMTRKVINIEQNDEIITASFVMRNKRVST